MRSIMLASLALFPVLVSAQAISPATTQAKTVLESKLVAPARPGAAAGASAVRVSTGVTYAKLVQSVPLQESFAWAWSAEEVEKVAIVHLVVEANGTPSHLSIAQGLSPQMDQDLLASVAQYRFAPARLNGENVPLEMDLTIRIRNTHK